MEKEGGVHLLPFQFVFPWRQEAIPEISPP